MSAFLVALVINVHYLFTGGGSTVVTRTHAGQTVNYWYFHCVYNTIIMHAYLSLFCLRIHSIQAFKFN